jgi:hypothetical protein
MKRRAAMIGLLLSVSLPYPSRAQQSLPKLDALKQ